MIVLVLLFHSFSAQFSFNDEFVPIFSFSAFGQLFISPASGALFSPFPFTCFFAHLASFLTVKRVSFRSRLSISSFASMEHTGPTGDNVHAFQPVITFRIRVSLSLSLCLSIFFLLILFSYHSSLPYFRFKFESVKLPFYTIISLTNVINSLILYFP